MKNSFSTINKRTREDKKRYIYIHTYIYKNKFPNNDFSKQKFEDQNMLKSISILLIYKILHISIAVTTN